MKKALSDMQATNQQSLATIYEKGDQNLEQMQQLEDLSKIIREKDQDIEDYKERINILEQQNRELHTEIIMVKKEAAEISRWKGENMLLSSTMKDKMLNDPRYRRLVEN